MPLGKIENKIYAGFILVYIITLAYIFTKGLPDKIDKYGDLAYYLIIIPPAIYILWRERKRIGNNILFNKISQLLFWFMCRIRDVFTKINHFIEYDIQRTTKFIWVLLFLQLLYLGAYFFLPSFKLWLVNKDNNVTKKEKTQKEQDLLMEMERFLNLSEKKDELMEDIKWGTWKNANIIFHEHYQHYKTMAEELGEGSTNGDILKIYMNAKDYSKKNVKSFYFIDNFQRGIKNTLELMINDPHLTNFGVHDMNKFNQNRTRTLQKKRTEQMQDKHHFDKTFRKIKTRYKKIIAINEKMIESKRKINQIKKDLKNVKQKSKPFVFIDRPQNTRNRVELKKSFDIGGAKANEYCLGLWFFVHGDTRRMSKSEKILIDFFNKPKISYDAALNKLNINFPLGKPKITIDDIKYQKWNYLVINVKNSRIDVFLNNKLMESKNRNTPYTNVEGKDLYLGDKRGHSIEIANFTYYHIPLTLQEIQYQYRELRGRNVPLF